MLKGRTVGHDRYSFRTHVEALGNLSVAETAQNQLDDSEVPRI